MSCSIPKLWLIGYYLLKFMPCPVMCQCNFTLTTGHTAVWLSGWNTFPPHTHTHTHLYLLVLWFVRASGTLNSSLKGQQFSINYCKLINGGVKGLVQYVPQFTSECFYRLIVRRQQSVSQCRSLNQRVEPRRNSQWNQCEAICNKNC